MECLQGLQLCHPLYYPGYIEFHLLSAQFLAWFLHPKYWDLKKSFSGSGVLHRPRILIEAIFFLKIALIKTIFLYKGTNRCQYCYYFRQIFKATYGCLIADNVISEKSVFTYVYESLMSSHENFQFQFP